MAVRSFYIGSCYAFATTFYVPITFAIGRATQDTYTRLPIPNYWVADDLFVRLYACIAIGTPPGALRWRLRKGTSATVLDEQTENLATSGPGTQTLYELQSLGGWVPNDQAVLSWNVSGGYGWTLRIVMADNAGFA